MDVPYDAINEVLGFCLKTAANSKEKSTVKLSRGKDLVVEFPGSKFKLRIQHDELGRPRVLGTGELIPMMFQHSRNFVLSVSTRRFDRKFEFFGLPAEVRNAIYGLIFQLSPNPPYTPWSLSESSEVCTEHFDCQEPLEPIRFLARTADFDHGISFVNRQALVETTPFLTRSKQYHVRSSVQLHALILSMGPEILSTWTGPLTLHLKRWSHQYFDDYWSIFEYLKEGELSKINRINIVTKRRGDLEYYLYPMNTLLGLLLKCGGRKFGSDLKVHFDPPLRDKEFNEDIHSQFEHALRGESWKGGYVDRHSEGGLILRLYEEIEEVDGNRRL